MKAISGFGILFLCTAPVILGGTNNPCDVNQDGTLTVSDVQSILNEVLGVTAASHDLNHDGSVNVTDVQTVVNAVLNLGCGGGSGPIVTDFNPKSGPIGTSVIITGINFGTSPGVSLPQQGGGTIAQPVTSSASGSITFVVADGTATGAITVNNSGAAGSSGSSFSVSPSTTFSLSASPGTANLIQGQSVTYALTLSSSNGFTQLASLNVSGAPAGVTASLSPSSITAGQTAVLTLRAPVGQPIASSNLSITASATVEGIPLTQPATVSVAVVAPTTSFIGRAVVSNSVETPLAGVTVSTMGLDGSGNTTGCLGHVTVSDAGGNFALTNLPSSCIGPQLISFNGTTVTSPAGTYAGVNLVFTLVLGQVVVSPVLVHMPRIDNVETFLVQQNFATDQTYKFNSIAGLQLTVYAGTTFTESDGSQPNPFPLAAIQVPVDRLPDQMPLTNSMVSAFIVAFQPANTTASQAVAVWFPNTLSTAPGTNMPLMTLDPTRGRMVAYGTGTVSNDATTIVPDVDPSTGSLLHRFGIVHFDWHGPAAPGPTGPAPGPGGNYCPGQGTGTGGDGGGNADVDLSSCEPPAPTGGDPVDLASGLLITTQSDIGLFSTRSSLEVKRTYRSVDNIIGPFGVGTDFNYNFRLDNSKPDFQAVVSLIMPNGSRFLFSRQPSGVLLTSSLPRMAGAVMTTQSDDTAQVRWRDGTVFNFVPALFSVGSVLVSIVDPNGNTITINRDPNDSTHITSLVDPAGRALVFAYNSAGLISSITDPIGRTATYTYDGASRLITFTDPSNANTNYAYDANSNLTQVTDPRGIVTLANTYDANQRVISQTMGDGAVFRYSYTLSNALVPYSPVVSTVLTDPRGNQWAYRFSTQGLILDVTDPLGRHRTYTRDPVTNQTLSIAGPGACQSCGNTRAGDFSFIYDQNGNMLTRTDSRGAAWSYTYDPTFNRLTSTTDPLGNVSTFAYDGNGNLIQTTDPRGAVASMTYSPYGQITRVTNPVGGVTSLSYNAVGDMIQATLPTGRIIRVIYDGASRQLSSQDQGGRTIASTWDAMNRPLTQTDPRGQTTHLAYDKAGDLLSVTDARGNAIAFTYDGRYRRTGRTDALINSEAWVYDAAGNLTQHTDRRGAKATFQYDGVDRRIAESYSDGQTVQRNYDANGRLIQVTDSAGGTYNYSYDSGGYLLKGVTPNGAVTYMRDLLGRLTSRQVQGQPAVSYSFDASGNLTQASSNAASITATYDGEGMPLTWNRSNSVVSTATYDPAGDLLSLSNAKGSNVLSSLQFSYDAVGQRAQQQVANALPLATPSAAGTANANNQLTGFGGHTYTYDLNGNRLTDTTASGTANYTWDARNHLRSLVSSGTTYTFQYDFAGNVVSQHVTGSGSDVLQRFVLDQLSNVVAIIGPNGTSSLLTGSRVDQHFAVIDPTGAVQFRHIDGVNSTTGVSDAGGTLTGQAFYEPFGATTESGSTSTFEFTGRNQVAPGLYYMRARFYDAAAGRFISEDPRDITAQEINLYRYGGNNPISHIDPLGLSWTSWLPDVFQAGFCSAGIGLTVSVDSSGDVDLGLGLCAGEGGSLTASNLLQREPPTAKQIQNCVTGWGGSLSFGEEGAGVTASHAPGGCTTLGGGLSTSGLSGGYGYTWQITDQ
jgi:RHS repeat-associated protein